MSIYRVFPLPEVDELKNSPILFDAASFPGCESFAIIGENAVLKSSLMLQAALSYVCDGDQIIYIRPCQFKTLPLPVHGMLRRSTALLDCIKMVYISEPLGLIRYLCEMHMIGVLPSAIIVEDFFYYVSHHQEHNKDSAVFKLFALLEDTAAYVSQKRNQPCHRLISMNRVPSAKSSMKKYFKEIWQLSFSECGSDMYLTDDHVPSFRIVFHIDEEEDEIVFDKLIRLPSDGLSRMVENS